MTTYIERKDGTVGTSELFRLRPGRESDHAFVVDSWLHMNSRAPRSQEMLRHGIYWTEGKAIVRRLLQNNRLRIAHAPEDDDAILGWACVSSLSPPDNLDPIVHYVYVRGGKGKDHGGARRCGIAKALLADFLGYACTVTHLPTQHRITLPHTWAYNPERVYR